jgi:hypothetical protein
MTSNSYPYTFFDAEGYPVFSEPAPTYASPSKLQHIYLSSGIPASPDLFTNFDSFLAQSSPFAPYDPSSHLGRVFDPLSSSPSVPFASSQTFPPSQVFSQTTVVSPIKFPDVPHFSMHETPSHTASSLASTGTDPVIRTRAFQLTSSSPCRAFGQPLDHLPSSSTPFMDRLLHASSSSSSSLSPLTPSEDSSRSVSPCLPFTRQLRDRPASSPIYNSPPASPYAYMRSSSAFPVSAERTRLGRALVEDPSQTIPLSHVKWSRNVVIEREQDEDMRSSSPTPIPLVLHSRSATRSAEQVTASSLGKRRVPEDHNEGRMKPTRVGAQSQIHRFASRALRTQHAAAVPAKSVQLPARTVACMLPAAAKSAPATRNRTYGRAETYAAPKTLITGKPATKRLAPPTDRVGSTPPPAKRRKIGKSALDSVAGFTSLHSMSPTHSNVATRIFPPNVPLDSRFPAFYMRYPASSFLGAASTLHVCATALAPESAGGKNAAAWNAPSNGGALDLYTPRFVRGVGASKTGLCPICAEPPARGGAGERVWLAMKQSAFKWAFLWLVLSLG